MSEVVWEAHPNPALRLLSLGAGVQSTTLLLMAVEGEIKGLQAAIFADTGWEPGAVYRHLEWLEGVVGGQLPIYRVSAGNLRDDVLASVAGASSRNPPFWVQASCGFCRGSRIFAHSDDCANGCDGEDRCSGKWEPCADCGGSGKGKGAAPLRRKCTAHYKIDPIDRKVRELLGVEPGRRVPKSAVVEKWLGISTDEATRIKPSGRPWMVNRYPLIERGLSRRDCLEWLGAHGFPEPPKSACIGCPYRSDAAWIAMRERERAEFEDAIAFERAISGGINGTLKPGVYLHRSLQPLDQVEFKPAVVSLPLFSDFTEECSGMCGV